MIETIHREEEEIEAAKESKKKKWVDLSVYLDMYQNEEVATTKETFSSKGLFDDEDLFGAKKTTIEKKNAKDLFADDDDL
jgi:hypothetical protein